MIVLIIEDESMLTELWQRFLTVHSADIRIAHDPVSGLALMRQLPYPNVVLLDLGLPGSGPRQTLELIPQIKDINPEATIIVITGNTEQSIMELSQQLGADYFARKPEHSYSQNALVRAIRSGLENATRKEPKFSQPLRLLEKLTDHLLSSK